MNLSMIITCKNQGENVERILRQLETVERKAEFEIIVVDDNSTDDSVEQIEAAAGEARMNGLEVRIERLFASRFAGGARNVGVKLARGEYIWLVDGDDCVPAIGCDAVLKSVAFKICDVYLLKHSEIRPDGLAVGDPVAVPTYADVCEWRVAPWSKVIRRRLFVPFREKVLLEDGDWWFAQCDAFDHRGGFGSIISAVCYQYDRSVPGQTMESFDRLLENRFKAEKPLTLAEMIEGKDGFSVGMPQIYGDRVLQIGSLIRLYQTVEHRTVREQIRKVLFGLACSTGECYHGLLDFVLP